MTYVNAIKYILSLPLESEHGPDAEAVERMRLICDTFGSPQKKLKFIHVTGEVGKDSCLSMLEAILSRTSYRFGRYSFSERSEPRECITINQKAISHSDLADITGRVSKAYKTAFSNVLPSRREILTLTAAIYFADNGCDVALIERDMQKNDPASITEPPLVSLLAPFLTREISSGQIEHVIPKGTVETVSSPQHKEILGEISNACVLSGSRLTVPIYSEMEIKSITLFKTEFSYRGEDYSVRSFAPCQTVNAITAIEVANAMSRSGLTISTETVKKGLFLTNLEGKCETLSIDPTVIVSSTYEKDRLDTLVAALAQVKGQFKENIDVYTDSGCNIDLDYLSDSLSSHAILHGTPSPLPFCQAKNRINNISSLSPDSVTVFIGSEDYVMGIKRALNDRL